MLKLVCFTATMILAIQSTGALAGGLPATELVNDGSATASFGQAAVAGDFNGDGRQDLAVGDPEHDGGRGRVAVYVAGQNGLRAAPHAYLRVEDSPNAGMVGEPGESFGGALAVGDFNGDGFDDLAIGSPGELIGASQVGRVHVRTGGARGFVGFQSFSQGSIPGKENDAGDRFGAGLSSGDVNGDGFDDLVVGAPGEDALGLNDSGQLMFVPGSASGLDASSGFALPLSITQEGVEMGRVLEVVDTDDDGREDVWVGVPDWEASNGKAGAGALFRYAGKSSPLSLALSAPQILEQEDLGGRGSETGDALGFSLSSGDYRCDGRPILSVGSLENDGNAGRLSYVRFSVTGALEHDHHDITLGRFTPGVTQNTGQLGWHLASADLDADGCDDLVSSGGVGTVSVWHGATGAPGAWPSARADIIPVRAFARQANLSGLVRVATVSDRASGSAASVVVLVEGSSVDDPALAVAPVPPALDPTFMSTSDMSFFLRDPTGKVVATRLADERRYNASTTKMLLNLLIMEAHNDGALNVFSDTVTVTSDHLQRDPEDCTLHGGSIGLVEGDTISWLDLIGFTTVRSAGDAAYASAVELSLKLGGGPSPDTAVQAMNDFAVEKGMLDTWYVGPSGRDAYTWWENDYNGPLPKPTCSEVTDDTEPTEYGDRCAHFSTARDLARASYLMSQDLTLRTLVRSTKFVPQSWSPDRSSPTWSCVDGGNVGTINSSGDREYNNSNGLLTSNNREVSLPRSVDGEFVGTKTGTRWLCYVAFAVEENASRDIWHGATLGANDANDDDSCNDERISDTKSIFDNLPAAALVPRDALQRPRPRRR